MDRLCKTGFVKRFFTYRRIVLALLLVWSAAIGGLAWWYDADHTADLTEMARIYARACYDKDVTYRRWNAAHGGVDVATSKDFQPNPYLREAERDMNPARQVHESAANGDNVNAHITSLKFLDPDNAPDKWQREALTAFEKGEKEATLVLEQDDKHTARLMRPLYVEQSCLKCHEKQGYKIGDVRGGISVTVPVDSIWKAQTQQARNVFVALGGIWMLGAVTIVLVGRSTNQRRLEREQAMVDLTGARQAAEAANRAKSEFLANMSHEIRTPMTAILGFTDILLGNSLTEESAKAAEIIKRNGVHLLDLINNILDLSKIEAGKCTVDLQPCSPCQIAAEVISLMKVRADAKGLPLSFEVQGSIPEEVTTDPIRVRQSLVNLVGNAIKFTEVGGVRVVMRLDSVSEGESKFVFDVIDTGIGMSAEQMGLLFRPFSQVDGSACRRFGGTGLGLAISKRMAEMLGGDIVVRSSPGQGSTFSFSIGIGRLDSLTMTQELSQAVTAREPVSDAPQHLDCRILLAEDGRDNQRLIAFLLRTTGAEVELADNGQIALDHALAAQQAGSPFDLIVMDMQMPVMDGYEATQKLRSAGYQQPIIALTAHAMTGARQKCLDAGCDDYLTKPINRESLVAVISRHAQTVPQSLLTQRRTSLAIRCCESSSNRKDHAMALTWDSSMTTGVRSVDEQHKELFRQVSSLKDAMTQGKGRDEIKRVLDFLGSYVVKHFAEEEKLMEEFDCPAASANKAAHNAFLTKFKELRARFDSAGAGPSLVLEANDVVTKWLVQHIKGIDTQLLASASGQEKKLVGAGS